MENREFIKRLHFVKGQLTGIEKMLEDGRPPQEIYVQLRSIESAFQKSILQTFEVQHKQALVQSIDSALENCENRNPCCDQAETLKKNVSRLNTIQVLDELQKFKEGGERRCVS